MSDPVLDPCPAWCERTHANVVGSMHRAEVGHVDIRGERLFVVVVQTSPEPLQVLLSGAASVVIDEAHTSDVRELVTLLGWPFLAQLIESAAFIVERFNAAAERDAHTRATLGS